MKKIIQDFVILDQEKKEDLEDKVLEWNEIGYELSGSLSVVVRNGRTHFYQAMVQYEE